MKFALGLVVLAALWVHKRDALDTLRAHHIVTTAIKRTNTGSTCDLRAGEASFRFAGVESLPIPSGQTGEVGVLRDVHGFVCCKNYLFAPTECHIKFTP